MKVGKYEFDSKGQALSKIDGLGEGHNHQLVKLGHIVLFLGEYDLDGLEIIPPIYSTKYSVDVIWDGLDSHPYGWATYAINVEGNGVHRFLGIDYQENKI